MGVCSTRKGTNSLLVGSKDTSITTFRNPIPLHSMVGVVHQLDSYPIELQQQFYNQGITKPILGLVSAVQSAGYGIVLGAIGIYLSKKIGLWKDETRISKKPLTITLTIGIIGGMVMILSDLCFFWELFSSNFRFVCSKTYNSIFNRNGYIWWCY